MQAHPQSSTAARIYPSSPRTASPSHLTPVSLTEDRDDEFTHPDRAAVPSSTAGRNPSQRELSHSVSEGAGLAHDAGNLLHALGLYCELLHIPGVLRPEHKHYATELRQLSERSSAMIRRLLKGFSAPDTERAAAVSAVESPSPSLAPPASASSAMLLASPAFSASPASSALLEASKSVAPVCHNPAETLHQQSALLQRIAAPWAIISVMTQDGLPGLEFSAEILERITVNLVLNAAEALQKSGGAADPRRSLRSVPRAGRDRAGDAPIDAIEKTKAEPVEESRAGRIRVSLRMAEGRLRLSVEDNGPGMPPGIAAAFLRPAPLPPGTARGLGHRIVHELAMATGGQLAIRVRPGAGTTFCLDWPVKLGAQSSCEGPTLRLVSSHRTFAAPPPRRSLGRTIEEGVDAC